MTWFALRKPRPTKLDRSSCHAKRVRCPTRIFHDDSGRYPCLKSHGLTSARGGLRSAGVVGRRVASRFGLLAIVGLATVGFFTGTAVSVQGATPKPPVPTSAVASPSKPSLPGSSSSPTHERATSKSGLAPKTLTVGGTWNWQNPLPEGNPLFAISCPSATVCFAIGYSGKILTTSNGGSTWTQQAPTSFMNAISCASAFACVAVGDSGLVMWTSNGGSNWQSLTINSGNFLSGVSCPASTAICFAVGFAGSILRTPDGGQTWTALLSHTTNDLFSVSCPIGTFCVAVGADDTIANSTDGNNWTAAAANTTNALFGISCLGTTYCMAVGQGGTVQTSTNPTCCWSPGDVGSSVTLLGVNCQPTSCFITGVDGSVYVRPPLQSGTVPGHGSTGENGALYGISCPTATTCFAVGDYGTIVVTTSGGTGWTPQSGLGSAEFGISCSSATVCIAVGFGGAIAGTTNGGTTWSGQTSGTAQSLNSVSCPSTTTCFAVGDAGTVIATTNGGTTWGPQFSNTASGLRAISCVSTTACFAVTNGASFIKTIDGATWSSPAAVGAATGLTGISCPTTTTCFATDADNPTTNLIYSTTNGGATWALSFNLANDPQAGVTASFAAIACPSATTCYAVGGSGLIAATSDAGLNWRTDNSRTSAPLSGVSCPSTSTCYASVYEFNGSTILHTTDFGGTWEAQYGGGTLQFAYTSISCPGTTTCFTIGYGGLAAATISDGAAWSTQHPSGITNNIRGLSCFGSADCYATAHGTLLATHDGGSTWAARTLGTTDELDAMSCPASNTCFAVGWPGAIYFTGDGGTTWTLQANSLYGSDNTFSGVSCASTTMCVIVGTGGTILTTTNGTAWTLRPSGKTTQINAVSCANTSSCVAVGDLGVALRSSNGGTSWSPVTINGGNFLAGVSCTSASTCYAVGYAGSVLVTTSGGASWTSQVSGSTANLFGISCLQTTICLAAGERGTTLVTLNGSNWTVRSTLSVNTLLAVAYPDPTHAWVAGLGGTILFNSGVVQGLCTVPTLSTGAASSPYASGSGAITLTATGSCSGGTQYEFFYKDTSSTWHLIGSGYGASNSATWKADYKAGSYTLLVEIRPVGSTASYITYTTIPFTLTGCGLPTLSALPASPQVAGTTVNWTGTVTCTGTPQYSFFVKSPAGVWSLGQNWGPSNKFAWISPATTGAYTIDVEVRNAGANEDVYDNYITATYTLR